MGSPSEPIYYKHDVFLCFKVKDTCDSFTTQLYEALHQAGISTFRDDDDVINRGDELTVEIERSIRESRTSIIVLSENFSNSPWHLNELLFILKQRKLGGHFVLPVFYRVDPSDVMNHCGSFTTEIQEGVKPSKWTDDIVDQWKAALTEVANLTGMVFSESETNFIAHIVHKIYSALDLRPSSFVPEFEHLRMYLRELKEATNSFSSKVIGAGGFGAVYEGVVSHSKGQGMVAIKRLNREFGQGEPEFWKEIMMLSRYSHKNLISLLGFCDENDEKILVYEHASHGSLDRHLSSNTLTWTHRLKICLDVANGLTYLHDHTGAQQRVIHRDIKSANILLDDNWNAKLSDMGLSKIGPANQPYTVLYTHLSGTPGYCDPQYMVTYGLTKESDIYSFGVVLFEVLCGTLCFKHTNGRLEVLVPKWKESYKEKKLDQIIFKDLTPSMHPDSLEIFSGIAFRCLNDSREQRPTISLLVERLQTALEHQERHDMAQTNAMGTPRGRRQPDELTKAFSKFKGFFPEVVKTMAGKGKKLIDVLKER